jgi:flagellar hook-associated protein 3 FlgL
MRISDSMKFRQVVANMQTSQRGMNQVQRQVSSGKRIQKPSEDPNAAAVIMQSRADLRGIEQFQRNIGQAIARVETEESVLNQLTDALTRALELAVSQSDDTANATSRKQVRYEIDNLLNFTAGLGNTRWEEGFLFAGHQSDREPFDASDPLAPKTAAELAKLDQPHLAEVATGQRVPSNHNGKEIFLDSKAFEAIRDLSQALGADDAPAIRASMDKLRFATERVQDLLGDVGGRYNHLEITERRLRIANLSTVQLRSELEDVDMAKAMVELVARQSSLQGAFMATSRILSLNLTDYLR